MYLIVTILDLAVLELGILLRVASFVVVMVRLVFVVALVVMVVVGGTVLRTKPGFLC
jgi:hypothetical protein